jgi:hypothetical protein
VVADSFSRIARFASLAICLIAVASFVAFAVEQSKGASAHQQAELEPSGVAAQTGTPGAPAGTSAKPVEGRFHKAIDDAAGKLSSPFSALTSGIASQWTLHIVTTLLLLLVYGFGLGLLARIVRFGD